MKTKGLYRIDFLYGKDTIKEYNDLRIVTYNEKEILGITGFSEMYVIASNSNNALKRFENAIKKENGIYKVLHIIPEMYNGVI